MHKVIEKFDTGLPFPDVFPPSFGKIFSGGRDYFSFRNLDHFRHVVSKLTQKEDDNCGISYEKALAKLLAGETDMSTEEQMSIRNLVRSNLHRRGLISEEVYEAYRYSVDGTVVSYDVAKYAAGEPDCVISPARQYVDFFYELYVSISYPYYVSNEQVRENCAKLCATIEELERQHIFIKIAMILPIRDVTHNRKPSHFFADVPLFSHKEFKDAKTMSSVINDRLLRKFFFAILEDYYDKDLSYCYGYAEQNIDGAMNIGDKFDEIAFFEDVLAKVGAE